MKIMSPIDHKIGFIGEFPECSFHEGGWSTIYQYQKMLTNMSLELLVMTEISHNQETPYKIF